MNEFAITVFDACVALLHRGAGITGMTYKEINVVVFVLLHPAATLYYFIRTNMLKRQ